MGHQILRFSPPHSQVKTHHLDLVTTIDIYWTLFPSRGPPSHRSRHEGCRERLRRIAVWSSDVSMDVLPEGVQSFEEFAQEGPWKDPRRSVVFWRDAFLPLQEPVYRVQKSGLCYFHGCDVLQVFLFFWAVPSGKS